MTLTIKIVVAVKGLSTSANMSCKILNFSFIFLKLPYSQIIDLLHLLFRVLD